MNTTTDQYRRESKKKTKSKEEIDEVLLQALPFRHPHQQAQISDGRKDRLSSWFWLRVPLLLLGIVGALGLLAHYNLRFADRFSMIQWPDYRISMTLLAIAGCVFLVLLIDWFLEKIQLIRVLLHPAEHEDSKNWRGR